jgi:glycosyltransferase involved in cell wall biosynthesis
MKSPDVSIILPTLNRVKLLEKSINSVIDQTLENWELLVIDDRSTDDTKNLLLNLSEKDSRIKYINTKQSTFPGISEYLNTGIKLSKGKYIARIDDDDTWPHRDKLRLQVEFFERNPEFVITGGGVIMVDATGREMYRFLKKENDRDIRKTSLLSCPFEHTTVMFRKETAEFVGKYPNLEVAEDWDFFLRLGKAGKYYNFMEYFTNYMQAGGDMSILKQSLVAKTEIKIIRTYKNDYPNFAAAIIIHYLQYLYSVLPGFIQRPFQYFLRYLKRNYL